MSASRDEPIRAPQRSVPASGAASSCAFVVTSLRVTVTTGQDEERKEPEMMLTAAANR